MGNGSPTKRIMNSTSQSSRSGCSIWRLGAVCTALIIVWFCLGDPATDGNSKGAGRILADMHAHTVESDGDVTAEQQIAKAAEIGLKSLWISDHDVIRNLTRVRAIQTAAKQAGITVGIGARAFVVLRVKVPHAFS